MIHDGIDCVKPLSQRIEPVQQIDGGQFVRQSQIPADKFLPSQELKCVPQISGLTRNRP